MLPGSFQYMEDTEIEEQNVDDVYPSKTYRLDLENNRIIGMVDELDAIRQAVNKMLYTDRYSDVIYSGNYGSDLYALRGSQMDYAKLLTPSYIENCLLQDDRISEVNNVIVVKADAESLFVSFSVKTIYGNLDETVEVRVNG